MTRLREVERPPTTTGRPRRCGCRACSTDARKASTSRCRIRGVRGARRSSLWGRGMASTLTDAEPSPAYSPKVAPSARRAGQRRSSRATRSSRPGAGARKARRWAPFLPPPRPLVAPAGAAPSVPLPSPAAGGLGAQGLPPAVRASAADPLDHPQSLGLGQHLRQVLWLGTERMRLQRVRRLAGAWGPRATARPARPAPARPLQPSRALCRQRSTRLRSEEAPARCLWRRPVSATVTSASL